MSARSRVLRFTLALVYSLATVACSERSGKKDDGDAGAAGASGAGGKGTGGVVGDGGASGSSGSSGAAGAGGAGATTTPSAGCGRANPAAGNLTLPIDGHNAEYIVSLPANYDPGTAYPLGFAFHGRGRTGPQCQAGDCIGFQQTMQDVAILVYMTSIRDGAGGDGWEGAEERELNVTFFQTLLDKLEAEYCVDESSVFIAGTSSGATFSNILACRFGSDLLAVAPVAGSSPERNDCEGQVAALVIHGVDDPHVLFASGQEARDAYIARNGCSNVSDPAVSELHDRVVATRESHECATYRDCNRGLPVTWCEHSEGGYDDSTHGWPSFGGARIWEFVSSLP
jgi:poly(3-hydroxybutyrate) depolymerase